MQVTRCVECNHAELSINSDCLCACHVKGQSFRTPAEKRIAELEAELHETRETLAVAQSGVLDKQLLADAQAERAAAVRRFEEAENAMISAQDRTSVPEQIVILREAVSIAIRRALEAEERLKYAKAPVNKGMPMEEYQAVCEQRDAAFADLCKAETLGAAKAMRQLLETLSPDGMPWTPKYPYQLPHAIRDICRNRGIEDAVFDETPPWETKEGGEK